MPTKKGEDGESINYYYSISARVQGLEVFESNYEPKSKTRVKREYKEGKLAYIKEVTLPSEAATSTQGDQNTVPGGANSSESKDKKVKGIEEILRNKNRRNPDGSR